MSFYTDSSHACCSRTPTTDAVPLDYNTVHNMYSSALHSSDKRDFDKVASLMAAILLIANEYGATFSGQGRKASFWWQRKEYTVTGEDGRWSVVQSHSDAVTSTASPHQGRKRSAYDYDSGFEDDYPDKKLKPLRAPSEQHSSEQCLPSLRAIAEECQQRLSPICHNSHDEAAHQRDASYSIPPGPPLTMFLPRALCNPDESLTRPANRAVSETSESPSPGAHHQRRLHYIINGEVRTVYPLSPNKMTIKSPTPLHHPVPRWEAALYIPQTPSPKPSDLVNAPSTSVSYPALIRQQQGDDNCQACQRGALINGDNHSGRSPLCRASPVSDRDVSPLALTPPRITSVEQFRSLTQVVDDVRADASAGIRSVAKAVERWEQEVARVNEVESW